MNGQIQTIPYVGPMRIPRMSTQLALCVIILTGPLALAVPNFRSSEIKSKGSEIVFCDLDGDHLKDILLIDEPKLVIFFQDGGRGFAPNADLAYTLGDAPSVVWPARLGQDAESLLVMTHEGVAELSFAGRKCPTESKRIITQRTVIPRQLKNPLVEHIPFSVDTADGGPVILIPVGRDMQLWRHQGTWRRVQSLENVLETRISAFNLGTAYDTTTEIDIGLSDINADRRSDIVVRTSDIPICNFALYTQQEGGSFAAEPTLTWTEKWDWSWYCWLDINRDGRADLIKNDWVGEPWFLPGTLSGKVIVQIYQADARGKLPSKPQQVFRKNDWIDSIPIVDIDGDGHVDLVLGYNRFDTREGFRKAFMAKQLDFNLRFHFYKRGTGFPEKPDFQKDLMIQLDQFSIELNSGRRRYFERFVNLSGDFDGDGRIDLFVRDRSGRVSVYSFISRQAGFEQDARLSFDYAEPVSWFRIADLNSDGVSDLVMKLQRAGAFRVFVSRAR
jgi:hypothetical protein